MPNDPPKLQKISNAECGSVLFLDDGGQVAVDVPPARLNKAMLQHGLPPLDDLIAARRLGIFVGIPHMTIKQWDRICECILASPVAGEVLANFPPLWASFRQPHAVVVGMPHRVYGGLSDCALYTSLPINFEKDPNRPVPWCRALLSASNGWLFNTWVHLESGEVEVVADRHAGHYIE